MREKSADFRGLCSMFQVGDQVVYGIHGVCRIIDEEQRTIDRKQITYLVLDPIGQPGARYLVPTHNAAAMAKLRKILSKEEMLTLLRSDEIRADCWIRDENQRKQTYRELISSGDRTYLMKMVCTLYRHKAEQAAAGRKVHQCDDNFLRDAERLLTSELSIVLELEFDQARTFLREQLKAE